MTYKILSAVQWLAAIGFLFTVVGWAGCYAALRNERRQRRPRPRSVDSGLRIFEDAS